jgi:hypothetical protein
MANGATMLSGHIIAKITYEIRRKENFWKSVY